MDNKINLPLWETISRSFMYIIKHCKDMCKICSVFIVLWFLNIASGQPMLCSTAQKECLMQGAPLVYAVVLYLACAIITVNVIRSIILRQACHWFHLYLGKPHFRFVGYNIVLALMVIIPSAFILMIVRSTNDSELSNVTLAFLGAAFICTLIGLSVLCCRLYLVYGGAAIGDRNMTLAKSYMLTQGNMLKICIGHIVLAFPTIILTYVASRIYFSVSSSDISQSLFSLWLLLCYFFESSIKGSYYSHLYQYFDYMSRKK